MNKIVLPIGGLVIALVFGLGGYFLHQPSEKLIIETTAKVLTSNAMQNWSLEQGTSYCQSLDQYLQQQKTASPSTPATPTVTK